VLNVKKIRGLNLPGTPWACPGLLRETLPFPTCFGSHWPIIRVCSCTIQSLVHIIICNVRNCGEIINAWFTDESMYTVTVAAYSLEYVHSTKVISFTSRPFCRPYRKKRRLNGPHSRSGRFGEGVNLLSLPEFETPVAHSQSFLQRLQQTNILRS